MEQTYGETLICPHCNYHYSHEDSEYYRNTQPDQLMQEACLQCNLPMVVDIIVEVRYRCYAVSDDIKLEA